jgi:hypothetical protein
MNIPCYSHEYPVRSPFLLGEILDKNSLAVRKFHLVLDVHPKGSRFFIGILWMPDFWTSSKII